MHVCIEVISILHPPYKEKGELYLVEIIISTGTSSFLVKDCPENTKKLPDMKRQNYKIDTPKENQAIGDHKRSKY